MTLQLKVSDTSLLDTVARNAQELGFDTLTAQDVLAGINTAFSVIRIALSVFGGISLVVDSHWHHQHIDDGHP